MIEIEVILVAVDTEPEHNLVIKGSVYLDVKPKTTAACVIDLVTNQENYINSFEFHAPFEYVFLDTYVVNGMQLSSAAQHRIDNAAVPSLIQKRSPHPVLTLLLIAKPQVIMTERTSGARIRVHDVSTSSLSRMPSTITNMKPYYMSTVSYHE